MVNPEALLCRAVAPLLASVPLHGPLADSFVALQRVALAMLHGASPQHALLTGLDARETNGLRVLHEYVPDCVAVARIQLLCTRCYVYCTGYIVWTRTAGLHLLWAVCLVRSPNLQRCLQALAASTLHVL